ncbi:MAG: type VI secretion system lipoprotein TssJ, partial [Desulfosarcinaceae bacterium]
MKCKFIGLWILIFFTLAACASQPLPPPDWTYEPGAIKIHLKADPKLNFDDGAAHTLVVCLYQLKDPNAFNQLAEDTDGIYKLLNCSLFDSGVATAKRLIVNPGQDVDLALDRAEGAKYVAVVAGYYTLEKARMIRMYDIPVVTEAKGWIKRTKITKPAPLKIDLELG